MASVLVIDDERVVRDLVSDILSDGGHDVRTAATATEALPALADRRVDLVFSDIAMPDLPGLDLLAAVRRDRPRLPVVLVTGHAAHSTVSGALAGGADALVLKPFSPEELLRAVAAALRCAARRAAMEVV